jgi:hypothetical protein
VANVNRPIKIITQPGPGNTNKTNPTPIRKNPAKNTAVFQAASAILLARIRALIILMGLVGRSFIFTD